MPMFRVKPSARANQVVVLYPVRQLNHYTVGGQFLTAGQFSTEHVPSYVKTTMAR